MKAQDHPQTAGSALPSALQDTLVEWPSWPLGHTLLAHRQLGCSAGPPAPSLQSHFQQVGPQPVVVHGAVTPQVQDPTFASVGLNSVLLCMPLQPVEVHLK